MITPTFHFKILENFVEVFADKSKIMLKSLQKELGKEEFDIYPYITRCALDIICGKLNFKLTILDITYFINYMNMKMNCSFWNHLSLKFCSTVPPSPGRNLLLKIPTLPGIEPKTAACKVVNLSMRHSSGLILHTTSSILNSKSCRVQMSEI